MIFRNIIFFIRMRWPTIEKRIYVGYYHDDSVVAVASAAIRHECIGSSHVSWELKWYFYNCYSNSETLHDLDTEIIGGMGDVIGTLVLSQLPRWMFGSKSMPAKKLIRDAVKSLKEAIDICYGYGQQRPRKSKWIKLGCESIIPPMSGSSHNFCYLLRSQYF